MTYCTISQLSFRYTGVQEYVLKDFSLNVEHGELVGILGQSGCGKSTLLRLIAGLEMPTAGSIQIKDTIMVDASTFVQPEQRGVGMVFQDYALFPHLTVEQNIQFGLHRMSRKQRADRVSEMLELVRLQDFRKRYPHELSGGQQQRAAFARAVAPAPAVLLMDEPFSNIDSEMKREIRVELKRMLQESNTTAILVTHDIEDANTVCDRIVQIENMCADCNLVCSV